MTEAEGLRHRIEDYLRSHHTMTLATFGSTADAGSPASDVDATAPDLTPHAASVFYAVDDRLRLIFLSKTSSLHSEHIGRQARVALTVSEDYDDWAEIKGLQMWGEARRLTGTAKVAAMGTYVARFPFVPDLLRRPATARFARKVAVYRVQPDCVAFTDNSTGVFGRELMRVAD
jgi:uncharacterized protein